MNMFERINKQLLVECEDSKVEWVQPWFNKIPQDAEEPTRTDEEQECYDLAWSIINKYLENNQELDFEANEQCATAKFNWVYDWVKCPCRLQFETDADYFCTIFHELVHSTGAPTRLSRPSYHMERVKGEYDEEELIAELGSMYLCAICCYNSGVVFEQSASYIKHYKKETFSSDAHLLNLAKMALEAVHYILGNTD